MTGERIDNHALFDPGFRQRLCVHSRRAAGGQQAEPLARVTLLLPGSLAVQSARKQLGDTAGVWLGQFSGLGWRIIDQAGLAVRRIPDPAVHRLVRHVLGQMAAAGQLTSFTPVWEKPGFQLVLLSWLREMKSQGILPEAVQAHAAATGQEHDRQLAEFYRLYQEFMHARGCMDDDGLLWLAAEALEQSPPAAVRHQLLIAAGFDQFNPLQVRMLRGIAPACAELQIYLAWDGRRPAHSLALARLALTRDRLVAALNPQIQELAPAGRVSALLERLRQNVFEPVQEPAAAVRPGAGALGFIAAPSRDAEVRWAFKAIKRLLLQGAPPDQVALHAPNPLLYRRLVEVVAAEYAVPVLVDQNLGDQPPAAAFVNLLHCLYRPEDDLNLAAVLRSPLFNLSDATLYRLRWVLPGADGAADQVSPNSIALGQALNHLPACEQLPALGRAAGVMEELWSQVGRVQVWQLLRTALDRTGLETTLALSDRDRGSGGRQRSNVAKFMELAHQDGGASLSEFLRGLDDLRAREAREGEALAQAPKSGAVQLMSIHASKGLEYAVVAAADLGRGQNAMGAPPRLLHDPAFGLVRMLPGR